MISLTNIDKYIEKQQNIQNDKMNKSIKNGINDIIKYIKKEKYYYLVNCIRNI